MHVSAQGCGTNGSALGVFAKELSTSFFFFFFFFLRQNLSLGPGLTFRLGWLVSKSSTSSPSPKPWGCTSTRYHAQLLTWDQTQVLMPVQHAL